MDAGRLIVDSRRRAGLSQRELGARAGLPQSAVSAYETSRVEPSVPVLTRLLEAAGFELVLSAQPLARSMGRAFTGPVGRKVQRRRRRLREWLEEHGFTRPEVFGSVARGEDTADSDVDILIDVPEDTGLVRLAGAAREASRFIEAPVDLIPRDGLRPDVAQSIGDDLVPL